MLNPNSTWFRYIQKSIHIQQSSTRCLPTSRSAAVLNASWRLSRSCDSLVWCPCILFCNSSESSELGREERLGNCERSVLASSPRFPARQMISHWRQYHIHKISNITNFAVFTLLAILKRKRIHWCLAFLNNLHARNRSEREAHPQVYIYTPV